MRASPVASVVRGSFVVNFSSFAGRGRCVHCSTLQGRSLELAVCVQGLLLSALGTLSRGGSSPRHPIITRCAERKKANPPRATLTFFLLPAAAPVVCYGGCA